MFEATHTKRSHRIKSLYEWLAGFLIAARIPLSVAALIPVLAALYGLPQLQLDNSLETFFGEDNPQFLAYQASQERFTRTDSVVYVLTAPDGDVFQPQFLQQLRWLTNSAEDIPWTITVSSLTNHPDIHIDEGTVSVENLVPDALPLDGAKIERIRSTAMEDPSVRGMLVSSAGDIAIVIVSVWLPEDRRREAVQEIMGTTNALAAELKQRAPGLPVQLVGTVLADHTLDQLSRDDMVTLVPALFVVVFLLTWLMLRSASCTLSIILLVGLAVGAALGVGIQSGMLINQTTLGAPLIILTVSVADGIHLLSHFLREIGRGAPRLEAMRSSMKTNLRPIFITTITTAAGFYSANFSESPPLAQLGTLSAIGVLFAFLVTITLVPTLVLLMPPRRRPRPPLAAKHMEKLSAFVTTHHRALHRSCILLSAGLVVLVPLNELTDNTRTYFDERTEFRQAMDYVDQHHSGLDTIRLSFDCAAERCISQPQFLTDVDRFVQWARAQPEVGHVSSYTDYVRRVHREANDNQDAFHRIPSDPEASSRYLILYEMSQPFGLQFSQEIDRRRSALQLHITLKGQRAREIIAFETRMNDWLATELPGLKTSATGYSLMFAHLGQQNIRSMLWGALLAIFTITVTMIIVLRSLRYGLLSMVPNVVPSLITLGIWGLVDGEVNMAVAIVYCFSLGIIVDDSVHFMTKYLTALENGASQGGAIRYAFMSVGTALATTTIILASGFLILALSDFSLTSLLGKLVGFTVLVAGLYDLLFLPTVLIHADKPRMQRDAQVGVSQS